MVSRRLAEQLGGTLAFSSSARCSACDGGGSRPGSRDAGAEGNHEMRSPVYSLMKERWPAGLSLSTAAQPSGSARPRASLAART